MNEPHPIKRIVWIGSSLAELRSFPDEVRNVIGYALYQAQVGRKAPSAKPLTGFGGAGVVEIVEDYCGDAYRAVYTIKFAELVYVLHAFQKKSTRGIATPKRDIELIKKRLKVAEQHYKLHRGTNLR